jgi:hypothetical protein
MVEIESYVQRLGLGSTRWTSTVPTPFGPAPGGGSFGGVYNSGFAATRNGEVLQTESGQSAYVEMEAERISAKGPFTVIEGPKVAGEVPSIVVNMRFTERGSLTQEALDKNVLDLLRTAGFRTSKKSTLKSVAVRWTWGRIGAEAAGDVPFYAPEVADGPYKGLRYAGPKLTGPGFYEPEPRVLSSMPPTIWVYSLAATSAHSTMSDGEAAQALTVLKQALILIANSATGAQLGVPGTIITRRTCPTIVFTGAVDKPLPKPVQAGVTAAWSALLLLVAYNMVASHVGSEVL